MTDSPGRVDAVVDAMLENRRPAGFRATPEELEALAAAAALSAARPQAGEPDADFVEALAARLRTAAARTPADAAAVEAVGPLRVRPGRRAFLRAAGLAAAAAAAGVVGDRMAERVRGGPETTEAPAADLLPAGAAWQDVAALDDLRARGPVRFRAGAVEGVVSLDAAGGVRAVSAVCTHMGCLLEVEPAAGLHCPCHGARFGLDGTPATNPYPLYPLPRLHSRIVDGRVQVLA